jgi:NAD(P)-dependent dehydrogenase (short-subunit alcohol dehydrogenase family)
MTTALQVVDGVDLSGKTCVITGASSGLGRESARALATAGAHVVLTGRNPRSLSDAQKWVHDEVPQALTSTVHLDLASLTSVRAAAAAIQDEFPAIHVLMNNAGVMFTPLRRTVDGFEIQFGTNHLGHFELTRRLIPQLVAADGARVVILSSGGHVMGDVNFDDPNWETREYDKFIAYGASKTANILHMVELDRRLRDAAVHAYCVHPGTVATSLARHMTRDDFAMLRRLASENIDRNEPPDFRRDFVMPEQGAATQVWASVSQALADIGSVYLEDCRISDAVAPYALDEERARRLWDLSADLCDCIASDCIRA